MSRRCRASRAVNTRPSKVVPPERSTSGRRSSTTALKRSWNSSAIACSSCRVSGGSAAIWVPMSMLAPAFKKLRQDAEATHQVLGVVQVQPHANAAGDGRWVGDEEVAGRGQVIGPAAAQVHQAGDYGPPRVGPESLEIPPHY